MVLVITTSSSTTTEKPTVKAQKLQTNKRTAEKMERDWREEIHRIEELGERPRITLIEALEGYVKSVVVK